MPQSQKLLQECILLYENLSLADIEATTEAYRNPDFVLKLGTGLVPSGKVSR